MAAPNLILRFILEMWVLVAVVAAALHNLDSVWRVVVAVAVPLALITAWGVFNVPDDPSRSGQAPVPVPGWLRLVIETIYFGIGVIATFLAGWTILAIVFAVAVILHYSLSANRVRWLLAQ